MLAANGVTFWADHASTQLMEYLKGRLIAGKCKLALKLNGGLARYLCSHEICAPKPRRERRMARLHDGSGRERCIGLAATAAKHYRRACRKAIGLADKPAVLARKPVRPTHGFKIAGASTIIGKRPLKLWKGSWKAAFVHAQDGSTL